MKNTKQGPAGVNVADKTGPGENDTVLGWLTFEKVAYDHRALVADEFGGAPSMGGAIDAMISEYQERGEILRSVKLDFPEEERR